MPKDPDKIREQIASLRGELKDAEKAQETKQKKKIARAAERAGLHKVNVTSKALESELRSLAQRLGSDASGEQAQRDTSPEPETGADNGPAIGAAGPRY